MNHPESQEQQVLSGGDNRGLSGDRGYTNITHLSLFSGIGGLDLAAEMAGFATVGQCEMADYPTRILEKHWPEVPRWRDIRTLTRESFYEKTGLRTVEVISGGFPCQPFSLAGKQKSVQDERYMWPSMLRVIRELTPRWVVGENVPGILRIAAADVVQDLEREGYNAVVFDFEAAAAGAPHRRERIAFVAHANNRSGVMRRDGQLPTTQGAGGGWHDFGRGTPEYGGGEWRTAEPGMGGGYDGLSHWMDSVQAGWADGSWELGIPRITGKIPDRANRLKCLGNAVVPAQFYPIFKAIFDIEKGLIQE